MENFTLEMSLKPFKSVEPQYVADVCRKLFTQWRNVAAAAETVSVMLWTADGSEILDYRGCMADEIEWARYIGGANPPPPDPSKPPRVDLHGTNYLYTENPPIITYATLKRIAATLKDVGRQVLDKPVTVGATFDPGPEFAKSPFKYERHREICMGSAFGHKVWVCSYATLNADSERYAGWPDGIPQDTPFGTFFGRQCRHFLSDLGFDFIWFSNGFGFGCDTWNATGAVFDGEDFRADRAGEIRRVTLDFWRLFRQECPQFEIRTRGTNLSTGVDLASDAVPLKAIYEGGFNMLPPPNSPWAAIDGDFGLELVGYMSHIARLPDQRYMFRFYTHDPWWMNSPWLDRYGREPHDIYLPLSIARIDDGGDITPPSHVQLLTADDSLGRLPDQVPNEVTPHLLHALATAPDGPSPLVWVYPFDEYHDILDNHPQRVAEPYFADWFIRGAINQGLPLNSVVSTGGFISSRAARPAMYDESVIVTPVPDGGSKLEAAIVDFIRRGGQALLYGPTRHASARLRKLLGVGLDEPVSGELDLKINGGAGGGSASAGGGNIDSFANGGYAGKINHRPVMSAGGMEEVAAQGTPPDGLAVVATVGRGRRKRLAALVRQAKAWKGGALGWVRGTSSNNLVKNVSLPQPDDPRKFFNGEILARFVLARLGRHVGLERDDVDVRAPYNLISRHRNGFFFSGYAPNSTAVQHLRLPQGAPLMIGLDTRLVGGRATYSPGRSWHSECRVFVEQSRDGVITCVEQPTVMVGLHRRVYMTGFRSARLRVFLPHDIGPEQVEMLLNPTDPANMLLTEEEERTVEFKLVEDRLGRYFETGKVTGSVLLSW